MRNVHVAQSPSAIRGLRASRSAAIFRALAAGRAIAGAAPLGVPDASRARVTRVAAGGSPMLGRLAENGRRCCRRLQQRCDPRQAIVAAACELQGPAAQRVGMAVEERHDPLGRPQRVPGQTHNRRLASALVGGGDHPLRRSTELLGDGLRGEPGCRSPAHARAKGAMIAPVGATSASMRSAYAAANA